MGLAWNICAPLSTLSTFFSPVFQVSTAKNEINLFHILIVAPVTFAPAGAMTPSAEFLFKILSPTLSLLFCWRALESLDLGLHYLPISLLEICRLKMMLAYLYIVFITVFVEAHKR